MNIQISKIDGVIILGGFIIALSSWIRFFTAPADLGETFLAGVLGLVIIFLGWLHNNQNKMAITLDAVEIYLADKPWEKRK